MLDAITLCGIVVTHHDAGWTYTTVLARAGFCCYPPVRTVKVSAGPAADRLMAEVPRVGAVPDRDRRSNSRRAADRHF
jgi:hypothetical protein